MLYLMLIITGGFAHIGVRFPFIVYGDAVATASNILASQQQFRLGIMADLMAQIIMLFLPLALFQLFKGINRNVALFMVIAGYMGVPITCVNMLNQTAAVLLLDGADYLKAFNLEQIQVLASFFLEMQKYGYTFAHIFFGIWLFPMGYLVYKSTIIPKFVGIWLILGGSVYVTQTFMVLYIPQYEETFVGIAGLTGLSEFVLCAWLIVRGLLPQKTDPATNELG